MNKTKIYFIAYNIEIKITSKEQKVWNRCKVLHLSSGIMLEGKGSKLKIILSTLEYHIEQRYE